MLRDEQRFPILLGAAGALIIARIVVMPLVTWQNELAQENKGLARQLAKAEQRIIGLPTMATRQAALRALLERSDAQLARAEENMLLEQQRSLERIFEEAKLTLSSFNWTLEDEFPEGHRRLRAEAGLSGSLLSFVKGVHALTTRTPHTDIVNFNLRLNQRDQRLSGRALNGTVLIDIIVARSFSNELPDSSVESE